MSREVVMNEHVRLRGAGRTLAVAWVGLHACAGSDGSRECPSAIAAAEGAYLECVEELGLAVEELTIDASGDIAVQFGEGYTPEAGELARRTCEPLLEEALALGLLACETTEIGRPATVERLRQQVERAAEDGFSGSVAIVRDGALLWSGGVGLADRALELENSPRTAFDCGSIMKIVTAAAIFQLESEGLISLDTALGELFAGAPPDKAGITLAQLVTHRAGFHEYHDTQGDFESMDRETALARIFGQELLFPPGDDEAYSNSGYTLLAAVVEVVSGMSFPEYIRTRLFDAANMSHTGVYGENLWPEGQAAVGYDEEIFGCNSPACWPAPSWALMGNGGLVSTVDDLVRWTAAVDGAVLFDAATRDAYRLHLFGGRGLSIDGEPAYGYSGRNDFGFGVAVFEVPGRETYVVVASNAARHHDPTLLMAQLAQMSLGALIERSPP